MGSSEQDSEMINMGDLLDSMSDRHEEERNDSDRRAEMMAGAHTYVVDAERMVLGGVLLDGERALHKCEDELVTPADFYSPRHRDIYAAMVSLSLKKKEITALTVADELNRKARLEDCGGAVYLSLIESGAIATGMLSTNAKMVVEKSRLRALIVSCETAIGRARLGEHPHEIIEIATKQLMDIERRRSNEGVADLGSAVRRMMMHLPAFGGVDNSRSTGFIDLDKYVKMGPGDLVILAARPSMGKTQLALDIACAFALDRQEPVTFFSMEMDAEQLIKRMTSARSGVNVDTPKMNARQQMGITDISAQLVESPLSVDDTPGLTIGDIRSRARAIDRRQGTRLVVVDYLQLASSDRDYGNKASEVADVSKGLKNLARELRAPVLALSQLNRGVEQRADRRPLMSDLRESGAIEQDADVITFLFREEYYAKDATPSDLVGVCEAIIAKSRNGPTGVCHLHFNKELPRFDNLSRRDDY